MYKFTVYLWLVKWSYFTPFWYLLIGDTLNVGVGVGRGGSQPILDKSPSLADAICYTKSLIEQKPHVGPRSHLGRSPMLGIKTNWTHNGLKPPATQSPVLGRNLLLSKDLWQDYPLEEKSLWRNREKPLGQSSWAKPHNGRNAWSSKAWGSWPWFTTDLLTV